MHSINHFLGKIRNPKEIEMNTKEMKVTRPHFGVEETLTILRLASHGWRIAEIAKHTHRSDTGIGRIVHKYGIATPPDERDYPAIEELLERLTGRGVEVEAPPNNPRERICIDCTAEYVMAQGEYDWFVGHPELDLPRRCPDCRKANRTARQAGNGVKADLSEMSEKLLGAYTEKAQGMQQMIVEEQARLKQYGDWADKLASMADELIDRTSHLAGFAVQLRESIQWLQDDVVADYDQTLPDQAEVEYELVKVKE